MGAGMAKSWWELSEEEAEMERDRREKTAPDLPALQPSDIDPVTGVLHWARFTAILESAQGATAGAVLVVDLDDRSSMIEAIAADSGREIVPLLAQSIRQAVRADDLVAHLYGYRFAVLLRGAAQEVANTVATRIQESVDDTMFMTESGLSRLGVAIGGVVFGEASSGQASLIDAALANLGAAKSADGSVTIQPR